MTQAAELSGIYKKTILHSVQILRIHSNSTHLIVFFFKSLCRCAHRTFDLKRNKSGIRNKRIYSNTVEVDGTETPGVWGAISCYQCSIISKEPSEKIQAGLSFSMQLKNPHILELEARGGHEAGCNRCSRQ